MDDPQETPRAPESEAHVESADMSEAPAALSPGAVPDDPMMLPPPAPTEPPPVSQLMAQLAAEAAAEAAAEETGVIELPAPTDSPNDTDGAAAD